MTTTSTAGRSGADVSVLTALHSPNPDYLMQAYESLQEQGIKYEWIIQVDGDDASISTIPQRILEDPRVHVGANGAHLGTAATRNLGLLRCGAPLVQNLDADDVLLPGALSLLKEGLDSYPECAFAWGIALSWSPETGEREQWQPAPYAPGIIPPGLIGDTWLSTGRHHVAMAGTMWRRLIVHAHGGWAAQRLMQDVSLMLAVSEEHPSLYLEEPIYDYRVHAGQSTSTRRANAALDRRSAATRLLAQRALTSGAQRAYGTFKNPDYGTIEHVEL